MVGSALLRRMRKLGYERIITAPRQELDLMDQATVRRFFSSQEISSVIVAAARVGGIHANNSRPAEFIYENLMIAANALHCAHEAGVQRILVLGSSCVYPREAAQPMPEEALLTGALEPTNEPYAVAKIAGIKLCESYNRQYGRDYRTVMPTNLYGPDDNFNPEYSHVLPALMRRFHEAARDRQPQVTVWGSGRPRREFMHVDDAAAACLFVFELDGSHYGSCATPQRSHINIGTGIDCSIRELAESMARVVGYGGRIVFDPTKPDGAPRKLLDVSRLTALGWKAAIPLEEGLRDTYAWFTAQGGGVRL
jgi:GDP-L-fucose synthase